MNKKLLIPGVLLLLCLPLSLIAAGITSYALPRQYFSRARIEYKGPEQQLNEAFQAATQLSKHQVTLQPIRNTSLIDIGTFEPNPQQAADRANTVAVTLQQTFRGEDQNDQDRVKIWEKAEVSLAPAKPNVPAFFLIAAAIGMLFAFLGFVLVIVAFVTRKSETVPPLPMPS